MSSPLLNFLRPTARIATTTLRPSSRPLLNRTLGLGFGASAFAISQSLTARPQVLRCDASPVARLSSTANREYAQYEKNAQTPVTTGGRLNAKAVRQVSAGSILGLVGGLAVSMFSKPLALLIGLLVFGVQTLESRGISIVPYGRLQGYFKNTNLRSAMQDNAAFKLCFGATFALASFGEF